MRDGDLQLAFDSFGPHPVHRVPTYQYKMIHAETAVELGRINLRIASTPHIELYAGHVGYGVHEDHRGHHYAARSLRLLMPVALQNSINPLWVTCDPENAASRRTLELAGGCLIEIVDVPRDCIIFRNGHPRKCRYKFDLRL